MPNNSPVFEGAAYGPGDIFSIAGGRRHPLSDREAKNLILKALINPTPGTLAAIEAYKNGKYWRDKLVPVVETVFIERPIPTFMEYLRAWWTGRWS